MLVQPVAPRLTILDAQGRQCGRHVAAGPSSTRLRDAARERFDLGDAAPGIRRAGHQHTDLRRRDRTEREAAPDERVSGDAPAGYGGPGRAGPVLDLEINQ